MIHEPQRKKGKHFAQLQDATCKDVERYFGVLQAKWQIVANPSRLWDCNVITDVLMACIIFHNMLFEGEEDLVLELLIKLLNKIQMKKGLTFAEYVEGTNEIDTNKHTTTWRMI